MHASSARRIALRCAIGAWRIVRRRGIITVVTGFVADHPRRVAVAGQADVVAGHQIIAGFDPPAPVALGTGVADRAVRDEVDLAVPLAVTGTDGAGPVKVAVARAQGYAVECMGIRRAGAIDDVRRMGHAARV